MISTLSTGFSKSDKFIKNNAVNTYTCHIQFDNDKKVHLTEDTAIPGSDIPVRHYVRCSALMFSNNIRICHNGLQFLIEFFTFNTTLQINLRNTAYLDIDFEGLLLAIQKKLREIGADIHMPYLNNYYVGCQFTFGKATSINRVQCNYAFAWIFGIITSFRNNSAHDTLTLFCRMFDIDLIGFDGKSRVIKSFSPLINRGINKMTVSSDELVMSPYMNGFKTATLAKISTNNNFIAIHSISAINTFILSLIKAHFTLTKHQDNTTLGHLPDDSSPTELEYYPTTYPDVLTPFQCSSEHAHIFNFVVVKMNAFNVMQMDPTNTAEAGHVGELRIGLESLKTISNLWYIKLKYFSHAKRYPLLYYDTLVILKTNIRLIDSKGRQLDTVMMRNHRVETIWSTCNTHYYTYPSKG